jgi:ATP-binding protein involved in chromosome partitioning
MPPGTGDIQITLSQSACMSGAVIVTTPHTLSLVDAAKGKDVLKQKWCSQNILKLKI